MERLAVCIDPAEEGIAIGGLGGCGKGDGALVRNVRHRLIGRLADHEGDRMHRCDPLGINGDILRGHGLAGEDILLFTCRISIPTGKNIAFLALGRVGQLIVPGIGDGGLELVGLLVYLFAVVHIDHVEAAAVVVEFGAVVLMANFRALSFIENVAGDGVLVLFGYRRTTACTRVGVIPCVFAVQTLKIVFGFGPALVGHIERSTIRRHRLDVGLVGVSTLGSFPGAARPLLGDVSAVFGGDALGG